MPRAPDPPRNSAAPAGRRAALLVGGLVLSLLLLVGVMLLVLESPEPKRTARATGRPAVLRDARAPVEPVRRRASETPPPPESPAPVPGRPAGRLVGRVTAASGREAVESAGLRVLHPTGELVARGASGPHGDYSIDGLPTDVPLVLEVAAPGYLTGWCCDVRLAPHRATRKDVEMLDGLRLGARVVLDPGGGPLEGAEVQILRDGEMLAAGTTRTDGQAIVGVPAVGELEVRLVGPRIATPPYERVDFTSEREAPVREFRAFRGGALELRVVTPEQEAVAGAVVRVSVPHGETRSGATDRNGSIRFERLHPGVPLAVTATASDHRFARIEISARDGHDTRAEVVLELPGRLVGKVTDRVGRAVPAARVLVRSAALPQPLRARADADGILRLSEVPVGELSIEVKAELHRQGRWTVRVEPGAERRIDAQLERIPHGSVLLRLVHPDGRPFRADRVEAAFAGRRGVVTAPGVLRVSGVATGAWSHDEAAERLRVVVRQRLAEVTLVEPAGEVTLADGDELELTVRVGGPSSAPPPEETAVAPGARPAGSVVGRLLSAAGPVSGARVSAGGAATESLGDGSFRLAHGELDPDEALLRVEPAGGLLMTSTVPIPASEDGAADVGVLQVRGRPAVLVDLRGALRTAGHEGASGTAWLSADRADEFLGRRVGPLVPQGCVTYDGTWMHLPPATVSLAGRGEVPAWEVGTATVYVGSGTPRGLATQACGWSLVPDRIVEVRTEELRRDRVDLPKGARSLADTIRFRQTATAVQHERRGADGSLADPPVRDEPFAAVLPAFGFSAEVRTFRADLAPGRYEFELVVGERVVRRGRVDVSRRSEVVWEK